MIWSRFFDNSVGVLDALDDVVDSCSILWFLTMLVFFPHWPLFTLVSRGGIPGWFPPVAEPRQTPGSLPVTPTSKSPLRRAGFVLYAAMGTSLLGDLGNFAAIRNPEALGKRIGKELVGLVTALVRS